MIYHLKTNSQGPKTKWVPKTEMISPAGWFSKYKEKALVLGQWLFKAHDRR